MAAGYRQLGWNVPAPLATMYIWARIPAPWGDDDFAFISEVFENSGVLLSPGSGFGIHGLAARYTRPVSSSNLGRRIWRQPSNIVTWRQ